MMTLINNQIRSKRREGAYQIFSTKSQRIEDLNSIDKVLRSQERERSNTCSTLRKESLVSKERRQNYSEKLICLKSKKGLTIYLMLKLQISLLKVDRIYMIVYRNVLKKAVII